MIRFCRIRFNRQTDSNRTIQQRFEEILMLDSDAERSSVEATNYIQAPCGKFLNQGSKHGSPGGTKLNSSDPP